VILIVKTNGLFLGAISKQHSLSREESHPSNIERPNSKDDTDTEGDESERESLKTVKTKIQENE